MENINHAMALVANARKTHAELIKRLREDNVRLGRHVEIATNIAKRVGEKNRKLLEEQAESTNKLAGLVDQNNDLKATVERWEERYWAEEEANVKLRQRVNELLDTVADLKAKLEWHERRTP
jgi:predicted nuclease with TOPRIM domain